MKLNRISVGLVAGMCVLSAGAAFGSLVTLQNATATFSQAGFPVATAIDGINGNLGNGWAVDPNEGTDPSAVFQTTAGAGFTGGTKLTFTLSHLWQISHVLQHFRLSATTDPAPTVSSGATWTVLDPISFTTANGTPFSEQPDHSLLGSGSPPLSDTITVDADTSLTGITGFLLETFGSPTPVSGPTHGPGFQTNGNFVLTEITVEQQLIPEPSTILLLALGGLLTNQRLRATRRSTGRPQLS